MIIAFWVTLTIAFKGLFALYYHFKWILTERCCLELLKEEEKGRRKGLIDTYWGEEFEKLKKGDVQLFVPSRILHKSKPKNWFRMKHLII